MASRRSATRCNCSYSPRSSFSRQASWARRSAPGSRGPIRRCSSSSPPVCRSSSWPASPGRAKRSRGRCSLPAVSSRPIWRSTASSALANWARVSGTCRTTGEGSGSSPSATSRSQSFRRVWSNGGTRMASHGHPRIIALGLLLVAAGAGGYLLWPPRQPTSVVGIVRATEIRVAHEVAGQLAAIKVRKGDQWRAGDVVAELSALELTASVGQARAALAAAAADRDHVYAGVRDEEIASLAAEIAKAKSRLAYVEAQLARTSTLARSDYASQQALDQARNDAASAHADVAEAEANHAAAKAGPTREQRAIADAQVKAAASALAVLQSRLDKTTLRAPAEGVVSVIVAEIGENVRAGQPVLAIQETGKQWLSFNAREDLLHGLTVGAMADVSRQGMRRTMPAAVTELRPLGSFATWQAERAVGDHDRNTLRLRLDPQGNSTEVEPGMTVWLNRGMARDKTRRGR